MERLTERNPSWIDDELWESACEPDCEEIDAVYRKLKDYEDLEEQGRLIKLPCKVGDTIYAVGVLGFETVEEYRVIRVDYRSNLATDRSEFYIVAFLTSNLKADIGFYDKEFGKNVFLTKSEAEAKEKREKERILKNISIIK